ncbi:MAG: hypothetical protein KAH56_06830 [Candidatus Krumholzibacteria bacterium]|nr:hypothetical protein [Candidatus Krumholzibacteria bacterium]
MPTDLMILARDLTRNDPADLDLTDPVHLNRTHEVADALLESGADQDQLRQLESALITTADEIPLLLHVAAKMAVSRRVLQNLKGPAHLSVVFAVYKEHQRILPPDQVAGGEDFLVRKVNQLEWLFSGRDDLTWDMIVVDDGCPEGSGRIAQDIVEEKNWSDRVSVLFLADAIAAGDPVTAPLKTPDDSRKGGSIALGMWSAAQTQRENHVIVFTDADLSTHLGQTGLLMEQILARGFDAAIGSRREPLSVVIKKGVRNTRGKLFIYLWKRIIDLLPDVVDTQCGFKGFEASAVRAIADDLLEKKFAFDIELLIKIRLRRYDSIARVPIAWIDSEALSTTTDIQPYLPMLQAMVGMYRAYLSPNDDADDFAAFIEDLDEPAWGRLVENIPEQITQREPAEFGGFSGVSADELRDAAGL